jgi:hypothetical protein
MIRAFIGRCLRTAASLIDPRHAPYPTGASFTFEAGEGFTVRYDGRGTPLWYLGDHAQVWAYTHADKPVGRPWVDGSGKPLPERQVIESLRLNADRARVEEQMRGGKAT